MELIEVKDQDGNILKKGDIVGFKAGMEQEGEIVRIRGRQITVKSLDREGFSGGYAAGQEYYDVMASDVWKEESVQYDAAAVSEAKGRDWTTYGEITIRADGDFLGRKQIQMIERYLKRWADGSERAAASMLPKNKRWKAIRVIPAGRDRFTVAFNTDAPDNGITIDNIENEIIGKDGLGGMLWQFAVHDRASGDLQKYLYGGFHQADDHMLPLRYVNSSIDPLYVRQEGMDPEVAAALQEAIEADDLSEGAEGQIRRIMGLLDDIAAEVKQAKSALQKYAKDPGGNAPQKNNVMASIQTIGHWTTAMSRKIRKL